MSTVVKDLGAVSAYAYAVEKGYTGTEAEFAELMADYAEVGQRAEDAADSALESKTAAQTAATTATNKASEATTAATTATNKAAEAQADADAAALDASQAMSAASTATTKASEATTAAATATSAATTATTAKDDAVSAKTAAQTAQTGAETAAASVSASAAQIATNAADISQLKSELSKSFEYDVVTPITAHLEGITQIADNYINDQGDLVSSAYYDCYYFVAPHDLKIWGDTSTISGGGADFQLKIYSGTPISSATSISTRYRLRFYDDGTLRTNTLPTEENPLSVSQGQIVLCAVSDNKDFIYYATGYDESVRLKSDVVLDDAQIRQVAENKMCKIVNGAPANSQNIAQINVYVPCKVGYARFNFAHTKSTAINADLWRIDNIVAVDDNRIDRFNVTSSGEIEFAVKLAGRSDFSGGRMHGDEVYTEAEFWLDGEKVAPDSFTSLTAFTTFRCCEVTNVYDPNDSTTIIAVHGREYIFDKTGVKISQTLEWKEVVPVTQLYMAMYTPSKTSNNIVVTNKAIFDTDFAVFTPTNPVTSTDFTNAKKVMLYAEESAHCSGFELLEYPTGLAGGDRLNIADNGGNNYNKIYAAAIQSLQNPVTSVIGEKLKSVAKYFVELGEIPNAS